MVDAQEVQDGRVRVVNVHGARGPMVLVRLWSHRVAVFVGDVVAVVTGLSIGNPRLDAATGHPDGKAAGCQRLAPIKGVSLTNALTNASLHWCTTSVCPKSDGTGQ